MAQPIFSHKSYNVGIICALACEKAAVLAMLDEDHPAIKNIEGDQNDYTFGKIGVHNVVITCLPSRVTGTISAATVANDMLRTFSIKAGLMVGIGGGVWDIKNDMRLGDVVVSQPDGVHGGVVQWDLGKTERDGAFHRTGSLNKPPRVLLNAVQTLNTKLAMEGGGLAKRLSEMTVRHPKMAGVFCHQGLENDWLFEAGYQHEHGETCDNCDISRLVDRSSSRDGSPRDNMPVIHYGNIASGDQVMKDGITRDKIAKKEGIICFEMEAAGLMDSFPCIVIRGVCDYADSHKNKRWQPYAAATAAAYAKELLAVIQPTQAEASLDLKEVQDILDWLSPLNFHQQQNDVYARHHPGTSQWFLQSKVFKTWIAESCRTLYCHGIPGSGKTILTSTVARHLLDSNAKNKVCVAYVYCTYESRSIQTPVTILGGLLKQIIQHQGLVSDDVQQSFNLHKLQETSPTLDEIVLMLRSAIQRHHKVYILVDALDEYGHSDFPDFEREHFLSLLLNLQKSVSLNLMFTSRPGSSAWLELHTDLRVQIIANEKDVQSYVKAQMNHLPPVIRKDPNLQAKVVKDISHAIQGMFLIAGLHVEALKRAKTRKSVLQTLQQLPKGGEIGEIYDRAIQRIRAQEESDRDLAERVLVWLTYAKKKLSIVELQHAMAVEQGERKFDPDNITDVESMLSVCAGLVTIDSQSNIIRLVHYTAQEYLHSTRPWKFPSAHLEIVNTSLDYLSYDELLEPPSRSLGKSMQRLRSKYPLLEYAATSWGDHFRAEHPWLSRPNSGAVPDAELLPKVLEFLRKDFRISDVIVHNAGHQHGEWIRLSASAGGPVERWRLWYNTAQFGGKLCGLHIAVFFDLVHAIEVLSEEGMDVDARDSLDETPLSWASRLDKFEAAKVLLSHGADANSISGHCWRPLHHAVSHGFEKQGIVELLLESGADVDGNPDTSTEKKAPRTPLHTACQHGRLDSVAKLLERGADPTILDLHQQNCLHSVVVDWLPIPGNDEITHQILEAFVKRGASLDVHDAQYSKTPLLHAAELGHREAVKLLLAAGSRVDAQDCFGETPLHYAAENGHLEIVQILVQSGSRLKDLDGGGRTPFVCAVQKGHVEVMGWIRAQLERGTVEAITCDD